jgi:3-phenylpropionate/cinnamic acid dioxygenase small subunit
MSTLSLRERIADFHAAYIRCIDQDALEQWPEFFEEQCHYTVTTAENDRAGLAAGLMWANNRHMLHDRVSALRHANIYERQSYRHILGLPFITGTTPEHVEVETPFMVVRIMHDGKTDLFVCGIYRDVFLLNHSDTLKLKRRSVICDSNRIDTLLAVPL